MCTGHAWSKSRQHAPYSIRCIISVSITFCTCLIVWNKSYRIICRPLRPPVIFLPHNNKPPRLYCNTSWANVVFFLVALSFNTRKSRDLPFLIESRLVREKKNIPISVCLISMFKSATFQTSQHLQVKWIPTSDLCAQTLPWCNLLRTHLFGKLHRVDKRNCICSWVALCVLFRQAVTITTQSSLDVVRLEERCLCPRLTFSVHVKKSTPLKWQSLLLQYILYTYLCRSV